MGSGLEIRDPVHGFIFREPHEQEIIDTPIFQRLRKLKQLALATLVYPGAVHTRFDHSLGAFSVAQRVSDRLLKSAAERRLVRLAALLHDVGHGPISHVSEDIFEEVIDKGKLDLKPKQQIHEALTAKMIMGDQKLEYLLSEREREQIVSLLQGQYGHSVLKAIISGPIDVDKQDYLLRDSHFCGVQYGIYDIERLIDTLAVHEESYDRFLAITIDGVHVLEQFVLAKYYMSTQVYRHRIRLITDEMIVRGVLLGITTDKIDWLRRLYAYDGSDTFVSEYVTWHDEKLVSEILSDRTPDGYAKELFRRLSNRRLFKSVYDGRPADFNSFTRNALFQGDKSLHRRIETEIARVYEWDPNLVFLRTMTHKSAKTQATTNEGQITVLKPGGPSVFDEESALFKSINDAIQEQFVQVYAPVEYKDEREKKKLQSEYHRDITAIIEKLANPQPVLPLRAAAERPSA